MELEAIAAIAALIVSVGSAFFTWGVLMQQVQDLKERAAKVETRLGAIDLDLRDGAVTRAALNQKLDGVSSQLDRVLDHLQELAPRKD